MATLYLTEQGLYLTKNQHRLVLSKNGKKVIEIPVFQVERILIFGNIQVSTQALDLILDSGIECSFLSSKGKFRGILRPAEQGNVFLRIAQYERYLDSQFRYEFSREIVKAKIANQINHIKRYAKNHPETSFKNEIDELSRELNTIPEEKLISNLLGIEGFSSSVYFKAFGKMVSNSGFDFSMRTRRPPRDPINALLSLGYTLVTNELYSLLSASGFDPHIGYYHELLYGRPSLALDVTEEFRVPLVDHLVMNLINLRSLSKEDFQQNEEDGGVYLKNESKKIFFAEYERAITEKFNSKSVGSSADFRSIFKNQVALLNKSVQLGEMYKPFTWEQ